MDKLLEKIKKIESLIEGAKSEGEKNAAQSAKERILKKYPELETHKDTIEYSLYTPGNWHKKLLIALCRKYGIKPYRYYRQKHTTVMIKANKDFIDKVLWNEYLDYSKHLEELVEEITDDLIAKIHKHNEEDVVVQGELE
jgi:hypothetical protein